MANITFSEGSGLNDSVYGKSQAPIKSFIEKRAEAFESGSMIPHLFAVEKSTHWAEKYTSMTAMDGFEPVEEGGATPSAGMQEGFSRELANITWKNKFAITREIMEDSKAFDLRRKPQAFVDGFYRTREQFAARLFAEAINNAKNSSPASSFKIGHATVSICGADGKQLFAKNHQAKVKGANQSNWFSNVFSADALAAVEAKMQNFMGDNGDLLGVIPDTILIPNDYATKKTVFAAIGADKDPATANNGFNFTYGRYTVIVDPYLNQFLSLATSTDKPWVLISSQYNKDYGGAIWQDRTDLDVKSYIDDDTDANIWKGFARFAAGFSDWRFAAVGGVTNGDDATS